MIKRGWDTRNFKCDYDTKTMSVDLTDLDGFEMLKDIPFVITSLDTGRSVIFVWLGHFKRIGSGEKIDYFIISCGDRIEIHDPLYNWEFRIYNR